MIIKRLNGDELRVEKLVSFPELYISVISQKPKRRGAGIHLSVEQARALRDELTKQIEQMP